MLDAEKVSCFLSQPSHGFTLGSVFDGLRRVLEENVVFVANIDDRILRDGSLVRLVEFSLAGRPW